ncbi:MAG: cytochrome c biogenesis protein CcdA [Pseudomonadota bacterium]
MSLAAGTIFLAGLLTFLSPCVLPLIPIYLSVLLGGSIEELESLESTAKVRGRWKLLSNGAMFIVGFTLVFVLLGMSASALGRFLSVHRLLFQQLGGLLVFMFGLKFLGWLHLDALDRERRFNLAPTKGLGALGALVMGFTFAFGWTPCIGPVLGAVLTFTATATDSVYGGAWYLFLYAMGVGLPLLALAVLAQPGIRLLNRVKRHIPKLERATGVILLAMAILMVTDSTSLLIFDSFASTDELARDTVHELAGGSCDEDLGCDLDGEGAEDGAMMEDFSLPRGPAVIDFYKPDCPACLKIVPLLNAMEATCVEKGMDLYRLDVSRPENRAFAAALGVVGTPTLIFVDGDGVEVSRIVGAANHDSIQNALDVIMGTECRDFHRFEVEGDG